VACLVRLDAGAGQPLLDQLCLRLFTWLGEAGGVAIVVARLQAPSMHVGAWSAWGVQQSPRSSQ